MSRRSVILGLCFISLLLAGCDSDNSRQDQAAQPDLVRLSVDANGVGGDGASGNSVAISADGMLVAFESGASNLVDDDTNGVSDIFLHDQQSGQLVRLSVAASGIEGNGVSDNVALSADGSTVAFTSEASNLTAGDTNGVKDLFVLDRVSGELINVAPAFIGAVLSDDGQLVAFTTDASLDPGDTDTTDDVYVFDRASRSIEWVSAAVPPVAAATAIDGSGHTVAITSGIWYESSFQLWRYDRLEGTTTLVGVESSSVCPQQGELTTNGSRMLVVACPDAANPFDWSPWVVDWSGPAETVEPLQGIASVDYSIARITGDGAYAVVSTSALKPGVLAEVVAVELDTGVLKTLSSPSNGSAYRFDADGSGERTVFTSTATDLVPDDVNGYPDVFVRANAQ